MAETATDIAPHSAETAPNLHSQIGKTDHCLNCGMPLKGESFCPNCGQKNDSRKLNAWELITEGISGFFSIDSRVFKSIRPMLFRPGQIVLNFCSGKKTSYVHPARMYLSVSIIYFLLQSIVSGSHVSMLRIEGDLDSAKAHGKMVVLFEPDSISTNEYSRIAYYVQKYPEWTWDQLKQAGEITPGFWKQFYHSHAQKMMHLKWNSFKDYVKSKLPIILFLIIPFLAVFLKLFYLRKGIYYSDHLVFAFYSQSTLFMLLTLGSFIDASLNTKLENVFFLVFFFYLYFSFRRVYKQNRLVSLLKLLTISLIYLSSGVILLILAGALLFLLY